MQRNSAPTKYRFVQRRLYCKPRFCRPASSSDNVEPGSYTYNQIASNIDKLDLNQLQTALTTAISAEDYVLASKLRDKLNNLVGSANVTIDWAAADIPQWLMERAENLGYKFPTEVQRRAAPVIVSGCDAGAPSCTPHAIRPH